MYYNLNGIPTNKVIDDDFWIKSKNSHYVFKKSDLITDIESLCIQLHNYIADKLISSSQKNYSMLSSVPLWIVKGGMCSEVKISKEDYEKFVNRKKNDQNFNKLLYFYDFTNLVSSLQNAVTLVKQLTGEFYKEFNEIDFPNIKKNICRSDIEYISGSPVINLFSLLNNIFISMYGLLDYTTKVFYEVRNIENNFINYPNLKSSSVYFKNWEKHINSLETKGTIFESSEIIQIITSIRNEIVNNISFSTAPKVFFSYENNQLIEKYILLPDFNNGTVKFYKNRKYFYHQNNKLNEILPGLVVELWQRIKNTLEKM
ncbi:hypothetical protein [Abyssalbus ytuae]|uniref:Uncharacterized protein n=1 Tax=Abyssalbus ytuae TaxID=2926907 RepID=A0A9E7CTK9_9FLAO|nr:hypothetical protein [Abyssalbus ytuae]UOB18251.1 hypothetical protein MQE35_02885 [Abyssalbus ytuae]